MAIDKNKMEKLLNDIDKVLSLALLPLPKKGKDYIRDKIMAPIYDLIDEIIIESRPPVIFLIGRSGHGKSSLINSLANKNISEVGDIKPTTVETIAYQVDFKDKYSQWTVVDTRGIFETTRPEGGDDLDPIDILKRDLIKYKPDIIIHVVAASELRNMAKDLKLMEDLTSLIDKEIRHKIPIILTINKVDSLGNPRDWPLDDNYGKMGLIKEALDYILLDVLGSKSYSFIDLNNPIKGYNVWDGKYDNIVGVCSLYKDVWNIETLSDIIGNKLPDEAILNFYQAQGRQDQLIGLSSKVINTFSTIAGGIALSPIPFSDTLVLTPLQLLMIIIIGGLSCRELNKDTAIEYLTAAGLNVGAAMGLRSLAQQVAKLVPAIGSISSSAIAASGTYAIGKSAEAYFFSGEIIDIGEFQREWKLKKQDKE